MKTILGVVAGTLLLMGALAWWVMSAMREAPPSANKVVEVQLVRPPPIVPPPPPPPPPEQQVDVPEPQQTPDIPEPNLEPAADSGVDGPPGDDAFGMSRGSGGTSAGGPYSLQAHQQWYAQKARDRIRALLTQRSGIKKGNYKVPIRVWIDVDGGLERHELLQSTGDTGVDQEIESALAGFGRMQERRPVELPPFRIRVEFRA